MYFESSPTYSATFVRKAMTSWFVTFSISLTRGRSNFALARMFAAASCGISPSSAMASQAAISTSSMVSNSCCSVQILPISGFV